MADSGSFCAPSAEDLFRSPAIKSIKLSPDGEFLTAVVRKGGVGGPDDLVIMPTDGSQPSRRLFRTVSDVDYHLWVSPQTILYGITTGRDHPRARPLPRGPFIIGREGGEPSLLSIPGDYRMAQFPARRNGEVLVWTGGRGGRFPGAGWLDAERNELTSVLDPEPGVIAWYADQHQQIRASLAVTSNNGSGGMALRYRTGADAPWETVYELEQGSSDFQGFDQDGRHLWVLTPETDRIALFRVDPDTGEAGHPVVADPVYDVSGALLQDSRGRALEISYMADLPQRVVLDAEWQGHYQQLSKLLPDTFNSIVDWDREKTRLLVNAASDRDPGAYYLYEPERKRLSFVVAVADWIHRSQMAPMEPVTFSARDGLRLHGYFTKPANPQRVIAPMILMPHGGPFGVRDRWGFNPVVQFLASRGYAVLQVNFRGSSGYGKAFELAGYGQWGLAMQDDLSDAVAWAVRTGRADPGQIGIFGSSYGGYAALMGLIKTPELYRLGISYAGVSDLELLYRNDKRRLPDSAEGRFREMFGEPEANPELFDDVSPVNHIERIRAPVLVAHGQIDGQVDIRHYRLLTRQLKKHGKEFQSFERRFEGHGLHKEANRIAFFETLGAFLARYMPTDRNPCPDGAHPGG